MTAPLKYRADKGLGSYIISTFLQPSKIRSLRRVWYAASDGFGCGIEKYSNYPLECLERRTSHSPAYTTHILSISTSYAH